MLRAFLLVVVLAGVTPACSRSTCGQEGFTCFSSLSACEKAGISADCCTVCPAGSSPGDGGSTLPRACPAAAGTAAVCGLPCPEAGVVCNYPAGFTASCSGAHPSGDASNADGGLAWLCGG